MVSLLHAVHGGQVREGSQRATGIYENPSCASEKSGLDHAVLLVGWGTEGEGKDYWGESHCDEPLAAVS